MCEVEESWQLFNSCSLGYIYSAHTRQTSIKIDESQSHIFIHHMAWPSTHNTYRLLSNLMCLKLQNSFKLASHIVVPCATMKHHASTGCAAASIEQRTKANGITVGFDQSLVNDGDYVYVLGVWESQHPVMQINFVLWIIWFRLGNAMPPIPVSGAQSGLMSPDDMEPLDVVRNYVPQDYVSPLSPDDMEPLDVVGHNFMGSSPFLPWSCFQAFAHWVSRSVEALQKTLPWGLAFIPWGLKSLALRSGRPSSGLE